MAHTSKGRTVENERQWQEKPSSPSPSLIDPRLLEPVGSGSKKDGPDGLYRLHPHFCFRHFYLSAFCPFDQSRIYLKNSQSKILCFRAHK